LARIAGAAQEAMALPAKYRGKEQDLAQIELSIQNASARHSVAVAALGDAETKLSQRQQAELKRYNDEIYQKQELVKSLSAQVQQLQADVAKYISQRELEKGRWAGAIDQINKVRSSFGMQPTTAFEALN
jgi:hypothetical protein